MDVLLILGTFSLPQFSAAIQVPLEAMGVDLAATASAWGALDPTVEARIGLITVVTLLLATASVGLLWNWRVWALSAIAFYAIYFTITGLHGLHIVGGIIALGYLWLTSATMWKSEPEHLTNRIECAGLYWHFVDLVWIFLFPILYLLPGHGTAVVEHIAH